MTIAKRALFGILTLSTALALAASPAWSQDDEGEDIKCTSSGEVTIEDGWLCVEELTCDDGTFGEDVCFRIN